MSPRNPRPWADWVERKAGALYQRALKVLFLGFALVCFWVASKIWATAGDLESWIGFALVMLSGLACVYLAFRVRGPRSLSQWLDDI